MYRFKSLALKMTAVIMAGCMLMFGVSAAFDEDAYADDSVSSSQISQFSGSLKTNQEDYYDDSVIYELSDTISDSDEISVIIQSATGQSLVDAYNEANTNLTVSEYIASDAGVKAANRSKYDTVNLLKTLTKSGIKYTLGETYDTVLSGFEVTIKAGDFEALGDLYGDGATLIVGETYEPAETEVVTNEVSVQDTGIFDSSDLAYQGDGIVVAILDTGLDYTHTAFSDANFTSSDLALTLDDVSSIVANTTASTFTANLTGEDVYVSKKVPYAYDYADKDADVFPINSEHGTHVAGVVAGKDSVITGVAPNAQLAIMKVFSDTSDGAKQSWILAALEDCVTLGVDVINMSLGSACGFSREVDEDELNSVYDSIKEAGISLVVAASNSYNATYGSTKNGNNALTSNPDSGTVGSPSTYDAALSVASVDGVSTPYMLYGDEIIYFNEATNSSAETKDFVDEILATVGGVDSYTFTYVTIPGLGRITDYLEDASYYKDKIVLVKRGTTTFEEKVRVALQNIGALGIIIYNNVSGDISMSVGQDYGAVCSISQDDGEMLAAQETGQITISRSQLAGPFMSDFSSWGPTGDLKIKPEITAHGGEILSAVPGQGYDRLSGTSMAAPNQSGATALIRQYVIDELGITDTREVTAMVNQLMMSTADIIYNKNALPYAVRKQGAGIVNLTKATTTASYITTYDEDGNAMDKSKIELGDDKNKTGVYEMTFTINNISSSEVTYKIDGIIQTEGVSSTYTSHGKTTLSQDGYLLSGTTTTVTNVTGGSSAGNKVTVAANGAATVTVKVVLSDEDKEYMDENFENGMYVEGFITFEAEDGTTVDMNVPMLAFYGDWTQAPIFDEEYYDTNVDELNSGLDDDDKLMADAYATRVIGGLYSDYIAYLGSYYFTQDPSATQIAASKEHIALSNQNDSSGSYTINSLSSVWAGLLRNCKEVDVSIVEDSTGKEVYSVTSYDQRKSYSSGSTIYYSSIDIDFSAVEQNLKNNTKYTVTVTGYLDYGDKESQNNTRSTFTFPLYIDFEAPTVTDVTFRTEYDRTTKKTSLYADISVYDNHYAMALQIGQVVPYEGDENYTFSMNTFGKYMTPIYSSYNSTSVVTVELTDYVEQLKNSAGLNYSTGTGTSAVYNNNSFIIICYDYALNNAVYEVSLPDDIISMYFTATDTETNTINLSPNETLDLTTVLNVYPSDSWVQTLSFAVTDETVAKVVNQTLLALDFGDTVLTATGYDSSGNKVEAKVNIHVLSEGEDGYVSGYTLPKINSFTLSGYYVNKAYYSVSSDDREIGLTGYTYEFDGEYTLSMYPSESVTLQYTLDSYFPEYTTVTYSTNDDTKATITSDGTIVAQAEGTTKITVSVIYTDPDTNRQTTVQTVSISVTIKDPFTTSSIYLMSYKGLGGTVEIPDDRGITTIYSFAFSNYEYVEKDLENGDVIDDEDPYNIKQWYIGDDTITKIIIPEGVEEIQSYAFANLTALVEVVFPSTLKRIGVGAFYNCTSLTTVTFSGENNLQFINAQAFMYSGLEEIDLSSVVAIGNYAFAYTNLTYIILPETAQSLGIGAFAYNDYLMSVTIAASKIKLGSSAFAYCGELLSISVNASVISSYAFYGDSSLSRVTLGKDVSVIGEYAFSGTSVSSFTVASGNSSFKTGENGALLYKDHELVLVAPAANLGSTITLDDDITSIASGAFAGNLKVYNIVANNVTTVGSYAFANCTYLRSVTLPKLAVIGDYAFYMTALTSTPDLSSVSSVGSYAFARTNITSVVIADGCEVGAYAFYYCTSLKTVTIGDGVTIGEYAFYMPVDLYTLTLETAYSSSTISTYINNYYDSYTYYITDESGEIVDNVTYYCYNMSYGIYSNLTALTIGKNVVIGDYAFAGNAKLTSVNLGDGATLGNYAFYNDTALTDIDLSKVIYVGDYAFSGMQTADVYFQYSSGYYYAYAAYGIAYIDGVPTVTDYLYTTFAAALTDVDLMSAEYIGSAAFAFVYTLTNVNLGDDIKTVSDYAFAETAIENIDLNNVTEVGSYAFYGTVLKSIDLSGVSSIGSYAFALTPLTSVTFADGTSIGSYAFYRCSNLVTAENLEGVDTIGAYAFYSTALTDLVLTDVTEIGDFAFALTKISSVDLGSSLTTLGENPFYGCPITTFGKYEAVSFNGSIVSYELNETYDVTDSVKVIDGVLYQTVPNGLELISYPLYKEDATFAIDDDTVRISARAFAGNTYLSNVTLSISLKAIGDKAFYGCSNLATVVFTSYEAPILEEEYDSYVTTYFYNFFPFEGTYYGYSGLGIVQYYMWNITTNMTNYFYGATFVNYVGLTSGSLVMVKPSNGQNYDSFIYSQYFGTVVEGSAAATSATLSVIAMIAALPSNITLSDEDAIVAARTAYDSLSSLEQQSLVTNISTLTEAETTLEYLKLQQGGDNTGAGDSTDTTTENGFVKFMKNNYIGLIIAGVAILVLAAYIIITQVKKKKL